MTYPTTDRLIAAARSLADALMDAAYTRKDEDKKRVAQAQMELCQARRAELPVAKQPEEKTNDRPSPTE